MDQEEGPGLSAARGHLRSAEGLLKSLQGPRSARPGRSWSARWRLLRRAAEDLRRMLTGWAPAMESGESPEAGRRRRELEARSLRAESALRELETRQDDNQRDWERVFAELERVQQGWSLLAEEGWAVPPPPGALPGLTLKADRVATLWARLLTEQAEAQRESARLEGAGRWITDVCLPALEAKSAGAQAGALAALRRRLEEMDRRRRAAQSPRTEPGLEESLRAELEESRQRERSLTERLEDLAARGASEAEQALVRGNSQAAELRGLTAKLEEQAALTETWKALCEESRKAAAALRAESLASAAEASALRGKLLSQVPKLEAESAALRRELQGAGQREEQAARERAELEEALQSLTQRAEEEARRLNAAFSALQAGEASVRRELADALGRASALEASREKLRLAGEAALRSGEERAEDLRRRLTAAVAEIMDLRERLLEADGLAQRSRSAEQAALGRAARERAAHERDKQSWKDFSQPVEADKRVLRLAEALARAKTQALSAAAAQAARADELGDRLKEMARAEAAQLEEAARLRAELTQLGAADASHRETAAGLHAELARLKQTGASQQETEARLRAELERLEQADASHRKTAAGLHAELARLKQTGASQLETEARLRAELERLGAADASHRKTAAGLHAELARLKQAGASQLETEARLRAELERLEQAVASRRETAARLHAELERFQQTDASHQETESRLRSELEELKQASLKRLEASPAPAPEMEPPPPTVPAPALEPLAESEAGPSPLLEDRLDPAWAKVAEWLARPLSGAHAQLRRLAALPLAEGHRAILRLAAAPLVEGLDALRGLREYFDESPVEGSGALSAAADAALAPWQSALRLRKIALVKVYEPGVPSAVFQAGSLRLVLYHLLRNAYEAMPAGGTLTVRVWRGALGTPSLSLADTGPGFSEEALAKAFSPFDRARPGHLGLGLALSRRILRRGGGELEAARGKPKGAVLLLSFAVPEPEKPMPMRT